MKKITGLLLFLIVALFGASYAQDEPADMDTSSGTEQGMSLGGAQGGPAMEYSYDQRNQFLKTMRVKYDGLQKRIDMLDENSKKSPAEVNTVLNPKVGELRAKSDQTKKLLDDAKNANRESWDETKSGIIDSLDELEKSVMEAEKMVR